MSLPSGLDRFAQEIAAQAREMLSDELAALEKSGAELRAIGVQAIDLGAQVAVMKFAGEDTQIAEQALGSAVQSLRAAGMIELASRIRKTLVGLFGIVVRTVLSVLV